MEPSSGTGTTPRRLLDRVAIVVLIGMVAATVGGVTLLTMYLNRLDDVAVGLQRVDPLGAYPGRPSPVSVDGVPAVNFLVMATTADGRLDAVLVAHLTSSRRHLALVALPADLLVGADGASTLADGFAADPLEMARAVETLTGARMDHQVHLRLPRFATVADTVGGLDLAGKRVDGAGALAYLAESPDALTRSVRTADLIRAALGRADLGLAMTDPALFDRMLADLTTCLVVDHGLTSAVIRSTMVESRIRADEVVTWPLLASTTVAGSTANPGALAGVRTALATAQLPVDGAAGTDPAGTTGSTRGAPGTSGITGPAAGRPGTSGSASPAPTATASR